MGKAKIMAKYRLVGKGGSLFVIFILFFISLFFLGNFSFLIKEIIKMTGLTFQSQSVETTVFAALSIIGIILFLLLVSPLRLGCERWFIKAAKGESVRLRELFYYYSPSGLKKSISAFIFCALRKTAALTLFLFPSLCLFGVLYFSFGEGEISLYISYALFGFATLLFILGLVFYFVYTARYFVYYSVIVSNKTISPQTAFDKSMEITEGAYFKLCLFRLSFLPWFLLCVLIFPAFYVWGYYKESRAMLSFRNDFLRS